MISIVLFVVAIFSQCIDAQRCPMPKGKLGDTLKMQIYLDYCNFGNSTYGSGSTCYPQGPTYLLRGQTKIVKGKLGDDAEEEGEVAMLLFGGEVCVTSLVTTHEKNGKSSSGCTSTCFNATTLDFKARSKVRQLITDVINRTYDASKKRWFMNLRYFDMTSVMVDSTFGGVPGGTYYPPCDVERSVDGNSYGVNITFNTCVKFTSDQYGGVGGSVERCNAVNTSLFTQQLTLEKYFSRKLGLPGVKDEVKVYFGGKLLCMATRVWEIEYLENGTATKNSDRFKIVERNKCLPSNDQCFDVQKIGQTEKKFRYYTQWWGGESKDTAQKTEAYILIQAVNHGSAYKANWNILVGTFILLLFRLV